ncbi:hypothetical protein BMR90_03555 [Leuconostoc mesenteroides subsp. cremoris]|uniref:hypothetical protein n=1 Tax=Leuconostoc mesenteroides TaxID=1245 RepID=UPI0009FF2187|nr:hypothetical protein [Leuconostoc mesenteroides]ORI38803.1 hypothetical protein BMR90_03555 [Leuconostoc mesenteroides subsp. cremoris]
MKIKALGYITDKGINSVGQISVGFNKVIDITFIESDHFSIDYERRHFDVYKITLSDGKIIILPAQNYMAIYEDGE